MKNTILSALVVISACYFLHGCKKSSETEDTVSPPGGPDPPIVATCSASRTAAENITIFPADNPWNKDVSAAAVDPYSTEIIAGFASNVIKADFGSGLWQGAPIGIPYVVVCGNQPKQR